MAKHLQDVNRAKIRVRQYSRELIKTVFRITEGFPQNDPDDLSLVLRKRALSISSFLSHGTAQSDKAEQGDNFIVVMTELRAVLKLVVMAKQKKFISDKQEALIRLSISDLIRHLDQLVKLLGSFD